MSIDWTVVQQRHVKEACRRYDTDEERPSRPARNTFLLYDRKKYPAKFIQGLAYQIATGASLDPNKDYTGGQETVRFFRRLGFEMEYRGKRIPPHQPDRGIAPTSPPKETSKKKKRKLDPNQQKAALKKHLQSRFGNVKTEVKFDWLVVPNMVSMDNDLTSIVEALSSYRGHKEFFTPGYKLSCDFYIPSRKLIIEYDERQHFTIARAISLSNYPTNLRLGFDKESWISSCKSVKARDSRPVFRDEQRAFYDTVRDILASRRGMTVVRIRHGDVDWESDLAREAIDKIMQSLSRLDDLSSMDDFVEEISHLYAELQRSYREWTKHFKGYEEVIRWLEKEGIDTRRCNKQRKFDLLSSHWNTITLPVLRKIAPDIMRKMKDRLNNLSHYKEERDIDRIWYLLYFIHPVRHELYYFDAHYEHGYSYRLTNSLRFHRQGLKACRTYLTKEKGRTIEDPFGKACCTTAFKHIHIHPTTIEWRVSEIRNLDEAIRNLEFEADSLSSLEKDVTVTLSRMATRGFERWIEYAPCAINEGPIFFTLKDRMNHSQCFRDIVEILKSNTPEQSTLRNKLSEYYSIIQ